MLYRQLGPDVTGEDLKKVFSQFGTVTESTIQMDRATNRSRGFGFVVFADEKSVSACVGTRELELAGKRLEVKRAVTREKMRGTIYRSISHFTPLFVVCTHVAMNVLLLQSMTASVTGEVEGVVVVVGAAVAAVAAVAVAIAIDTTTIGTTDAIVRRIETARTTDITHVDMTEIMTDATTRTTTIDHDETVATGTTTDRFDHDAMTVCSNSFPSGHVSELIRPVCVLFSADYDRYGGRPGGPPPGAASGAGGSGGSAGSRPPYSADFPPRPSAAGGAPPPPGAGAGAAGLPPMPGGMFPAGGAGLPSTGYAGLALGYGTLPTAGFPTPSGLSYPTPTAGGSFPNPFGSTPLAGYALTPTLTGLGVGSGGAAAGTAGMFPTGLEQFYAAVAGAGGATPSLYGMGGMSGAGAAGLAGLTGFGNFGMYK